MSVVIGRSGDRGIRMLAVSARVSISVMGAADSGGVSVNIGGAGGSGIRMLAVVACASIVVALVAAVSECRR